jgi:hypothetical protein
MLHCRAANYIIAFNNKQGPSAKQGNNQGGGGTVWEEDGVLG